MGRCTHLLGRSRQEWQGVERARKYCAFWPLPSQCLGGLEWPYFKLRASVSGSRRMLPGVVVALGSILLFAACSSQDARGPVVPVPTARAVFDERTGEIRFPIDDYSLVSTRADKGIFATALNIDLGRCMRAKGFVFRADRVPKTNTEDHTADRRYGLWDVEEAKKFGLSAPDPPFSQVFEDDHAAGGVKWEAAIEDCQANPSPDFAGVYPTNEELAGATLPNRIANDASSWAREQPEWNAAREAWWACLRKDGLTPETSSQSWSVSEENTIPMGENGVALPDNPQSIRIAYSQARCNVETGMAQTLGNLEASYQAALIAKNQAALNVLKTEKAERLKRARDFIAKNG